MQVTLSTGAVVHFRPWKHKAARIFSRTLKQGIHYHRDLGTGDIAMTEEIPANNFDEAYEAVVPVLIEKIVQSGSEIPFTAEWLDGLEQPDYQALEKAVYDLKNTSREAGEKNH